MNGGTEGTGGTVLVLTLAEDAGGPPACPRTPVLACRDALVSEGVQVELITAGSDSEIDGVIARLDGPARSDGLCWPAPRGGWPRLIVAAAVDGQVRAVIRRMVRRYAPPPSRRPKDLARDRTLPDLPPIGILPLYPTGDPNDSGLLTRLGLPGDPAILAKAVCRGDSRRLDLLRNDRGSVTLNGALLGGVTDEGQARPWMAGIEVDDAILARPDEQILVAVISNSDGYSVLDGLPLTPAADPADGVMNVAVALPTTGRSRWGRRRARIEVRRASGRAASITPAGEIPFLDDGVTGRLSGKRAWWLERGAWAVFRP